MTKSLSNLSDTTLSILYVSMVRSASPSPPTELHRETIAAALRELVNQLRYIGITEKNILEIADEMEGK